MVFGPWRALSTSSRTAEGAPRTWPVLRAARRHCRRGAALSWGPSVDARGVAERRRLRGAGDGRLPAHAARGRQQHARLFARTRHGAARERGEGLRRRGRPRDADARQRGVRPGDPVVLVRLWARTRAASPSATASTARTAGAFSESSTRATAARTSPSSAAPPPSRHARRTRSPRPPSARSRPRRRTESAYRTRFARGRRFARARHTTDAVPSEPLADAVPRGRPRTGADAS